MNSLICSGNETVDEIGMLDISGNIIHNNWYRWVLRENGKPNHLAISLLAEIVYWYKPVEVRDEETGLTTAYRKKFKGDCLQKSYSQLGEKFGEEKQTVKRALDCLEELGVIKKEFRTITVGGGAEKSNDGKKMNNVLYIHLIPGGLQKITYSVPGETCYTPVDKFEDRVSSDLMTASDQICGEAPDKSDGTNTENTTEITTEITTTTKGNEDNVVDVTPLFEGLGLEDGDIRSVFAASGKDIDKCRNAVDLLRQQKCDIKNSVGWLIRAVREGYRMPTAFKGSGTSGDFGMMRQSYDYEALEKQLVANW